MPNQPPSDHPRSDTLEERAPGWRLLLKFLLGVVLLPVGILWVLQGADVIHIEPIVCVAKCEPVTGGSRLWFAIGLLSLLAGLWLLLSLARRTARGTGR
jgi:hypothetical protein